MKAKETPQPKPVTETKRTPLENFVDGFPIDLAKLTLSTDLAELLMGGDVSAYMNVRAAEYLPTAVLPVRQPMMPLGKRPMPEIGSIQAETEHFGTLTLDAFLSRSNSYSQAYLVVHKGDIVYEQYPRMRREDNHLWMSTAKTTAGLIIDMLISDGKIDPNKTIGFYVPEFRGTAWENIKVIDVLDMAPGFRGETPGIAWPVQSLNIHRLIRRFIWK